MQSEERERALPRDTGRPAIVCLAAIRLGERVTCRPRPTARSLRRAGLSGVATGVLFGVRLAHRALSCIFRAEDGQNVVEYGLLMASIEIVVLVAITSFGNQIQPWFTSLALRLTTVT